MWFFVLFFVVVPIGEWRMSFNFENMKYEPQLELGTAQPKLLC